MQLENLSSYHHDSGIVGKDRATAVLLTRGGIDGVSAFLLRHWGPGANWPEPVFVIWLLNIGRFCLTVKYGRHSLQRGQWRVNTGSGPRITPSPLEQARVEALSIRDTLQEGLNRPLTVAPALALFDTDLARRIERLARRRRIPLLWGLEVCTGKLAPMPRPEAGSYSPWSGGRPWRRYRRSWRASIRSAPSRPEIPAWASGPRRRHRGR